MRPTPIRPSCTTSTGSTTRRRRGSSATSGRPAPCWRGGGYQVVVIGSPARAVPYRLTLEEMAATGSLATMDRIGDPSGDRVTLTTDGRTLELQGAAHARPRGVRFDRPSSPLGGSAQDSLQFTLDVDGAPSDGTNVQLGSDGHVPSGDRIALDASLESPATPPRPPPRAGGPRCPLRWPA